MKSPYKIDPVGYA